MRRSKTRRRVSARCAADACVRKTMRNHVGADRMGIGTAASGAAEGMGTGHLSHHQARDARLIRRKDEVKREQPTNGNRGPCLNLCFARRLSAAAAGQGCQVPLPRSPRRWCIVQFPAALDFSAIRIEASAASSRRGAGRVRWPHLLLSRLARRESGGGLLHKLINLHVLDDFSDRRASPLPREISGQRTSTPSLPEDSPSFFESDELTTCDAKTSFSDAKAPHRGDMETHQ